MNFYGDLSEEERADWRKMDGTRGAMKLLRQQASDLEEQALAALGKGNDKSATWLAGEAAGIRLAIDLMENDR